MIDIKCTVVNKVYRGQDFWKHYCSTCDWRDKVAFDGTGYMVCPNLRYYQSYKPKRSSHESPTSLIGTVARIPRGGY